MKCDYCGKEITVNYTRKYYVRKNNFCNFAEYMTWKKAKAINNNICAICGNLFIGSNKNQMTCSKNCGYAKMSLTQLTKNPAPIFWNCEICQKEFRLSRTQRIHYNTWNRRTFACNLHRGRLAHKIRSSNTILTQ